MTTFPRCHFKITSKVHSESAAKLITKDSVSSQLKSRLVEPTDEFHSFPITNHITIHNHTQQLSLVALQVLYGNDSFQVGMS